MVGAGVKVGADVLAAGVVVGLGVKLGVDGIAAGVVVGSGGVAVQATRMNRNAKKAET
jgi:hypothetical protein